LKQKKAGKEKMIYRKMKLRFEKFRSRMKKNTTEENEEDNNY